MVSRLNVTDHPVRRVERNGDRPLRSRELVQWAGGRLREVACRELRSRVDVVGRHLPLEVGRVLDGAVLDLAVLHGGRLEQVAFGRLGRQPVDDLAHVSRVGLGRALVLVFVDEHDVQVAAVTEFLASQFAVTQDGEARRSGPRWWSLARRH